MLILADTNILLRLAKSGDPDYTNVRYAVDALTRRGDRLFCASQNFVEFWNVCTRPIAQNGFGLSASETDERVRIIEAAFQLLPDTERVHIEWRRLVVQYAVAGTQVHDARLVAAMIVNGMSTILTLNDRDFARYSEISAVHPRDLLHS